MLPTRAYKPTHRYQPRSPSHLVMIADHVCHIHNTSTTALLHSKHYSRRLVIKFVKLTRHVKLNIVKRAVLFISVLKIISVLVSIKFELDH